MELSELQFPSRTLSSREGAIVAWLEAERRPVVSVDDVAASFPWNREAINDVLSALERKRWLRRTARGRYETILAETGGFAPPNPWAALSTWAQPYYVALQSAAYELDLTPDRPGVVQVAAPVGARAPKAWAEQPITLVPMRAFSLEGVIDYDRHSVQIRLATVERVLVDAGALPGRVGGPQGLARIATRAAVNADWELVDDLASRRPGGGAVLRRLAATLELAGAEIPVALAAAATAAAADASYLYLGERRLHGTHGRRLRQWAVVDNVGEEALREEIAR
jgi:predicted transcriptional regulator of viral defense system